MFVMSIKLPVISLFKLVVLMVLTSMASLSLYADEVSSRDNMKKTWGAHDWLMYMQKSIREQNYIGTFMFSRGNMSSTMSIVHRFENGIESERLKQLDGEMGEIVRTGKRVMCVFPDNRVVEVESSPLSQNFTNKFVGFMPGQSQYELRLSGNQRMAEHSCTILDIVAKDQDRYSYRLWIDDHKGLLLKSDVLDLKGNSLEKFQYTHLEYPDKIDTKHFEFDSSGEKINHEMIPLVQKDETWPEAMMWDLGWMPEGYMKINGKTQAGDNILVYSDGLATFSVFVETMKKDAMPEGASMVGATIAYSMDNKSMDQSYHVTVVGEIPPMTAMKIATSVKPKM